jgi:hypothetical protein
MKRFLATRTKSKQPLLTWLPAPWSVGGSYESHVCLPVCAVSPPMRVLVENDDRLTKVTLHAASSARKWLLLSVPDSCSLCSLASAGCGLHSGKHLLVHGRPRLQSLLRRRADCECVCCCFPASPCSCVLLPQSWAPQSLSAAFGRSPFILLAVVFAVLQPPSSYPALCGDVEYRLK